MEFIGVSVLPDSPKVLKIPLTTQVQYIPDGRNLNDMVQDTAIFLQNTMGSDGFIYYNYDKTLNSLYICPEQWGQDCGYRSQWNVEHSGTIATFAFKNQTPLVVDTYKSVDLNFPYLQDITGLHPKFIMSIPMLNFHNTGCGVVDFFRDDRPFKEHEVAVSVYLLKQIAETFRHSENATYYATANRIQMNIQKLIEMYTFKECDSGSYRFLNDIMEIARDCTRAQSAFLYRTRKGALKKVVSTVNGYEFTEEEDNPLGLGTLTRSSASATFFAMMTTHRMHAVIKVYNKIGQSRFAMIDEQILGVIAKMASTWAMIESMSGYLKKQHTLHNTIRHLIKMQMQRADEFGRRLSVLVDSSIERLESWNYEVDHLTDVNLLNSDVVRLIEMIKGDLPMPKQGLRDFVVIIELCHCRTAGDNYAMSVRCVQILYLLLKNAEVKGINYERFAMMIAALSYRIAVFNEPTATSSIFGRYNHYAYELVRFEIVSHVVEETKILSKCPKEVQDYILNMIKDFMIFINLKSFKKKIKKFGDIVRTNKGIDPATLANDQPLRTLFQSILPGVANLCAYFKTRGFRMSFPNFNFFGNFNSGNPTCLEILQCLI